jgi:hypothetical protein
MSFETLNEEKKTKRKIASSLCYQWFFAPLNYLELYQVE